MSNSSTLFRLVRHRTGALLDGNIGLFVCQTVPALTTDSLIDSSYRIRRRLDDSSTHSTTNDDNHVVTNFVPKSKINKPVIEQSAESRLDADSKTSFIVDYIVDIWPITKQTLCKLPLSTVLPYCTENDREQLSTTQDNSRQMSTRKLRTKKEQRAKQFIRSHATKLGAEDKATERRVDETMKSLYKSPSLPPIQMPPVETKTDKSIKRVHSLKQHSDRRLSMHINRDQDTRSNMNSNESKKKRSQTSAQIQDKTRAPIDVRLPPATMSTTVSTRLRTLAEVIQEEASILLTSQRTAFRTAEDIQEETNESVHERVKRADRLIINKNDRHHTSNEHENHTVNRTIDENNQQLSENTSESVLHKPSDILT
jgi:hypothetical protein